METTGWMTRRRSPGQGREGVHHPRRSRRRSAACAGGRSRGVASRERRIRRALRRAADRSACATSQATSDFHSLRANQTSVAGCAARRVAITSVAYRIMWFTVGSVAGPKAPRRKCGKGERERVRRLSHVALGLPGPSLTERVRGRGGITPGSGRRSRHAGPRRRRAGEKLSRSPRLHRGGPRLRSGWPVQAPEDEEQDEDSPGDDRVHRDRGDREHRGSYPFFVQPSNPIDKHRTSRRPRPKRLNPDLDSLPGARPR